VAHQVPARDERVGQQRNTRAIDALLNYETVKYFNNEAFEASALRRKGLEAFRRAQVKSQTTLSMLNTGQQLIIASSLVAMLWRATQGVVEGRLTLGDLVMINAFLIQLYIPLELPGRAVPRGQAEPDRPGPHVQPARAPEARWPTAPTRRAGRCRAGHALRAVRFAYDPARPVLHGVSFEIRPGKTVAVVGPSGSGKSTLARLLYRFYDVTAGAASPSTGRTSAASARPACAALRHRAAGHGAVQRHRGLQHRLRPHRVDAAEVEAAARAAHIHDFIASTPKGYETMVGERGLKLSGGEKQRVAIARTLAEEPAGADLRRGHLGARFGQRARHPGRIKSAAQGKTAW
jgi:ABC-type transport system involved in Fe-S cluster assembly fused permease/ATPase subunit